MIIFKHDKTFYRTLNFFIFSRHQLIIIYIKFFLKLLDGGSFLERFISLSS